MKDIYSFMAVGIAAGVGIGAAAGVVFFDDAATGVAMGIAVGAGIGAACATYRSRR